MANVTDDDLGLLNCPRGEESLPPPAESGGFGVGRRLCGWLSRAGWRTKRVSTLAGAGVKGGRAPRCVFWCVFSQPGPESCRGTPDLGAALSLQPHRQCWGQVGPERSDSSSKPRAVQGSARRGDNSSHYSKRRSKARPPPGGGTSLTG